MAHVVGPKGQVVIEKEIRDKLGIEPGWITLQVIRDDHIELYFIPPEHDRSLKGVLRDYIEAKPVFEKDWGDLRDEAWAVHVRERLVSNEAVD